jgi:hypothetical protein
MKSAGVTPFRYTSDRLEALVCIGTVGLQRNKILSFGGSINPGEAKDVAACRELLEESGMHLNGSPITPNLISPCVKILFPQRAEMHKFFHYYIMIQPSDVVSFEIPSDQHESKSVDSIAGYPTELIHGTMERSHVAWVPVEVLLTTENVFENFLEVLFLQLGDLPSPVAPSATASALDSTLTLDSPSISASAASVASAMVPLPTASYKPCPTCTLLNSGDKTRCKACGSELVVIDPSIVHAFAQLIQHSKKGKKTKGKRHRRKKRSRK